MRTHVLGIVGLRSERTHTLVSPVVFLAIFSRIGISLVSLSLISFSAWWLLLGI